MTTLFIHSCIHNALFFAALYWELEFKNLADMTFILQQLVNVITKTLSCCTGGSRRYYERTQEVSD